MDKVGRKHPNLLPQRHHGPQKRQNGSKYVVWPPREPCADWGQRQPLHSQRLYLSRQFSLCGAEHIGLVACPIEPAQNTQQHLLCAAHLRGVVHVENPGFPQYTHAAPVPLITAGRVNARILKSSNSDQWSM
jgi:hypothetical protein